MYTDEPEPNEPTPTACSSADCIIADLIGDTLVYVAIEHDGITEPTDSSNYFVFTSANSSRQFFSDGLMLYECTFETQGNKVKGTFAMLYPIT